MILALVSWTLSLASAPLPLEGGFLDPKMPPGLTIRADEPVLVGPPQRRLVRTMARHLGGIGYSTREASFRLPRRGDASEAMVWATTDGPRALRVRLRIDLSGEQPRIVDADTTHPRQFSPDDSTRMDMALAYLQSGRQADLRKTLGPLVSKGYPEALVLHGGLLLGDSTRSDRCEVAAGSLRRAIDSGLAAAHAGMGRLLLDPACAGRGSSGQAFQHLVEACDRGVVSSMVLLGFELLQGERFPKSVPMGVFVLAAAAANRDPEARAWWEDARGRLGDARLERAGNEGRLRFEAHHLGLRPLPVSMSCRLDTQIDSVVLCAVRSGILVDLVFDGEPIRLPPDRSQELLLHVARGNIDQATALLRERLDCLQTEALDLYDLLKAQVPTLPPEAGPGAGPSRSL
jgi:hypothetical protein